MLKEERLLYDWFENQILVIFQTAVYFLEHPVPLRLFRTQDIFFALNYPF